MSDRRELIFKETRNIELSQYPGEDGPTQVLKVMSLFSRPLSHAFRCHDLLFGQNEMPRRFAGKISLGEKMDDVGIRTPDGHEYLANWARGFSVTHPKEGSTDPSLEVTFTLHFAGNLHLNEFLNRQNKDAYELVLLPPITWNAQGEFAFANEPLPKDEPAKNDFAGNCVACENDIPLIEGEDPPKHQSGALCTRPQEPVASGPVLASAREAAGGTHQRGKRGRRRTENADQPQEVVQ